MQVGTAAANDLQVRFSIGDRKMEVRKARALSITERLLWGIPVGKRNVFYGRKAANGARPLLRFAVSIPDIFLA